MIRLTLFFLVLSLAAVSDIRKRMIPDWMPLLIAGVSLLPPEPVYLTGLLVALPLLIAGITVGGIGGGDIKLTGACGLVLGFERTLSGLLMALMFARLEAEGEIHLSLVFRGDADKASEFIKAQDQVLDEIKAAEEEALQEEGATEEDGQPVMNADGQETTEEEETTTDGEE